MDFGGYRFEHICDIQPVRGAGGELPALMPQDRYAKRELYPLNRYGAGPFCRFRIPAHFGMAGVYVLAVGDEVRYIGETKNLSRRYNMGYGTISPKNCYKGGQETNVRLNNLIYRSALAGETISLWFHATSDYKAVESVLRSACQPPWNRI